MKIFFVGNYKLDNGPANVNKNIKKVLEKEVLFIENDKFVFKILEIFWKVIIADIVIISGLSPSNNIAMNLATILQKKSIYIMHGSIKYENNINQVNNESEESIEENILKKATLVLCVSKMFREETKKIYPQYAMKIDYLNNGIDWNILDDINEKELVLKDDNMITVIGGGRAQKNNLQVCKAIEQINKKYNKKYVLYVIGEDGSQTDEIKSYEFVRYIGKIKQDEVLKYLKKSKIYIQNSTFETFGLAPIEALQCKCHLILSGNMGIRSIINTLKEEDLIVNINSIEEIATKILVEKKYNNNSRLIQGIDKYESSCENKGKELLKICNLVFEGKYYGGI